MAQVAAGGLDAPTLDMAAREGVDALADDNLVFYLCRCQESGMPGE
ncbi:MAG TPA: hypothetical protein VGD71_23495 [Kribbella sp.]